MSISEIVAESLKTATQVPGELALFLGDMYLSKPVNFMEIGTDRGGTFRALGRICQPGGFKISLDLPRYGFWRGFDYRKLHHEMIDWFPGVHLIHRNSHALETYTEVARLLGDTKLDLLFVDGDHSYEGVKRDFEMYAPLVRSGGSVAFHDIVPSEHHRGQGCHVGQFWSELTGDKRNYCLCEEWGGIGVWVNP